MDIQLHNIDKFRNKVYNAGGGLGNSASLLEMTGLCQEITGNKININSIPENRPADLRIYISDNTLIEKEISWRPEKTVKNIFEDIYGWLKANEQSLKPLLS